jgi:hypothetical protein
MYSRLVDAISLKFMGTAQSSSCVQCRVVGCWILLYVLLCGCWLLVLRRCVVCGLVGGDVSFASIDTMYGLCT